ncbi:hypothetical protein IIZ77_00620 [Candidatus Saccharibacteria bacterium]|nr:hypothetical protein [Candidatus Saccharibacteria bacterium]
MPKSSDLSNKPSIQPDVSPQLRSDYSIKQTSICLALIFILIAVAALIYYSLDAHREQDLKVAIANADESKLAADAAIQKVTARERELDTRERELDTRERQLDLRKTTLDQTETDLASRESDLALERTALRNEKSNFYAKYERVFELSTALAAELDPKNDEDALIVEELTDEEAKELFDLAEETDEPLG